MKKINLCTMLLCIFFTSYHFYCSDSSLAQQHRSNVNVLNEEFLLQIHRFEKAIVENNQEELDDMLQKNSALVHVCLPEHNLLPLELAIRTRSDNALDVLLAYKASVATIDSISGDSLPHVAARYGNRYAVEKSLEKGLPVRARNRVGKIPVHLALMADDSADPRAAELVDLLLQSDPSTIDAQDDSGATPLHCAALHTKKDVVLRLMYKRPNVSLKDKHGNFALDYAISNNNPEIAQLIFTAGNPYDSIMKAKDILDLLYGFGRVSQDDLDQSLFKAASQGVKGIIAFLLKKGACVNADRCEYGCTPLHCAVQQGDVAIIQALIDAGANVNAGDWRGATPLHYASRCEGHELGVRALINAGARVDARDSSSMTPLDWALSMRNEAVIKALLDAGASTGERNRDDKNTPANPCVVQ